jgi:hypothetical protein
MMLNTHQLSFRSHGPLFTAALILISFAYLHLPQLSARDQIVLPTKLDAGVDEQLTTWTTTGAELGLRADPLKALCDNTKWTPGLWLQCTTYAGQNKTAIHGGLNNARNRVQTCIRLAIDSGSGLIIPPIAMHRGGNQQLATDFSSQTSECPEAYWDISYMAAELQQRCPQLELRFCGNVSGINTIVPTDLRGYDGTVYHNGKFGEMIASTLKSVEIQTIDPAHPVAVSFGDSYIAWNYTESNESLLRKSLFKILPHNSDLLRFSQQILQSPELSQGFIAVHLRGERDWPKVFGNVDQQMDAYIEEIERVNETQDMKIVYVSCGWKEAIGWFRGNLETRAPGVYTVHDKWSLSKDSSEKMAKLEALRFDEMAIVEYQVLLAADYWYGVLYSTMSHLVAYARTASCRGFLLDIHPTREHSHYSKHTDLGYCTSFERKQCYQTYGC